MGQYHRTVNLDKRECLNSHNLGDGAKLVEQCGWSPGGVNDALHLLLAVSNGRGGGDFNLPGDLEQQWVGRWGGDRIAVIGDYAEPDDLKDHDAKRIYRLCSDHDEYCAEDDPECNEDKHFLDITTKGLVTALEYAYECAYVGDGWKDRVQLHAVIDGWQHSHRIGDIRVASIIVPKRNGHEEMRGNVPMQAMLDALHKLPAERFGRFRRDDEEWQKITMEELGLVPTQEALPGGVQLVREPSL